MATRFISILFIIVANIAVLAHGFVPHHHHHQTARCLTHDHHDDAHHPHDVGDYSIFASDDETIGATAEWASSIEPLQNTWGKVPPQGCLPYASVEWESYIRLGSEANSLIGAPYVEPALCIHALRAPPSC